MLDKIWRTIGIPVGYIIISSTKVVEASLNAVLNYTWKADGSIEVKYDCVEECG